jgi:hypothetical protein
MTEQEEIRYYELKEHARKTWRNVGELVREYQPKPSDRDGVYGMWEGYVEIEGNLYIDEDFIDKLKKHGDLLDKMRIKGEVLVGKKFSKAEHAHSDFDPKIQSVIDKYYPCKPGDETKAAAKVAVGLGYITPMILIIGFGFGYGRAQSVIVELEKLGIISPRILTEGNGLSRDVLVTLKGVDAIFKDYKTVEKNGKKRSILRGEA